MKNQYGAKNQQLSLNVNKSKGDANKFYASTWFPWVAGPLFGSLFGFGGGYGIKHLVDRKYVNKVNQLDKSGEDKDEFIRQLSVCFPVRNTEDSRTAYLQLLEDISNVKIDCEKITKINNFKFKITKKDSSVSLHDPNRILGEFSFRDIEDTDDNSNKFTVLEVTFPESWNGIGSSSRRLKYGSYTGKAVNDRKILSLLVLAHGLIDMRGNIRFDTTVDGEESVLQKHSALFQVANALYERINDKVQFGLKNS